jgi:CheY-like chemotaxis protein
MNERPRILVVEDQYFVAADCELNLRSGGFDCVGLATTAREAVDLAQAERPDLILMDTRLASRADGVEAAIVIYERLGIRCILCGPHADDLVRAAAERARPLGWLNKPYTGAELIDAVREGLAQLHSGAPQRTQSHVPLH